MAALDLKIKPLYARGLGCRQIGEILNEDHTIIYKRLRRMGILRNRSEAIAATVRAPHEIPFTRSLETQYLPSSALGDAIQWFLERGYKPSLPIDVSRYDLVVESDDGLKRIQIKTTTAKTSSGRWIVGLRRHAYDKHAIARNAAGKRRHVPYSENDVDFFYILTADRTRYIIPIAATKGALGITLDVKFAKYAQRSGGGTGRHTGFKRQRREA